MKVVNSSFKMLTDIDRNATLEEIEEMRVSVSFTVERNVLKELLSQGGQEIDRGSEICKTFDTVDPSCVFVKPFWVIADWQDVSAAVLLNEVQDSVTDLPSDTWLFAMHVAEKSYFTLLEKGWPPEQARTVLPNSLKASAVVTLKLEEWKQVLRVWTSCGGDLQLQKLAVILLAEFKKVMPVIFC
jgi:thymidylate synthase ThyX